MSDISKRYGAVLDIAKQARGRRLASMKPKAPSMGLPKPSLEAKEFNAPVGAASNVDSDEGLEAALVDYERSQHGGRIPTVEEEKAEEQKKRGMR